MQNEPTIKRGDRVIYVKEPKKVLKVISDPELFNGAQVVTCVYLPPGKRGKSHLQHGLYDVEALEHATDPP